MLRRSIFVFILVTHALGAMAQAATRLIPPSAPHGARAIVIGTGLDDPSMAVTFRDGSVGAAPGSIVSRGASMLELSVPAAAVSGPVQVARGGTVLASLTFALLPDPSFVKVSTLAASDKAHDLFKDPAAVAVVRGTGVVIVADRSHHRIVAVTPAGAVSVLAGTGKPGLQTARERRRSSRSRGVWRSTSRAASSTWPTPAIT